MGPRIYRLLVRFTPRAFRDEYGDELCRVVEEQWTDRRSRLGPVGRLAFWARQAAALLHAYAGLRHPRHRTTGRATLEGFARDLEHAVRGLARRPGFAAVTILTLGLGIGATTAIFSAVHTVLLRPLPYADADRVAVLFQTNVFSGERGNGVSAANVRDIRERATTFDEVAVAEPWSLDLEVDGRVESLRTWAVSRGFFEAIGAEAAVGRTFVESDYTEDGATGVVIGHRAWLDRFGGDPDVIGRSIPVDGAARTVLGVLPAGFRFPDAAEMWIPRPDQPRDPDARASDFMTGVVRLRAGASMAQAQAEADGVATTLRESFPRLSSDLGLQLVPLREHLFGDVRPSLTMLGGAVCFLLLIACANVTGLMLARGAQRERDYALRSALGASTGRLVGQVSAESLVLALAGCALGVLLTRAGVAGIRALGPDRLPRIDELRIDATVLAFAVAVGALSAVLSGFAPSLRLSRPDLRGIMAEGARGAGQTPRRARGRSRLVVGQVAAAVVLLVGAGLLIRSFGVLLDQELGFDPSDRLALQVFAYDDEPGALHAFVEEAADNLRGLPGVLDVGLTTDLPGATDGAIAKIDITVPFTIADRAAPPAGQAPEASIVHVSEGYFETMDIEVVEGRDFDPGDDANGAPVVVVSQALARRHFGDRSPVGERLYVSYAGRGIGREVVGVVRDTRPRGYASQPRPEVYLPLAQVWSGSLTFVVHAAADAGALTVPAMEAIWSARPSQAIWGTATVDELVAEWHQERRFNVFLLTTFSVIALLLSAVGLYGVVSFSVERRVGELGIRRALGGRTTDLVRMVVGEGARLAGSGLAIGLVAAWILSRFIRGMLFEISPTDPLTFVVLAALVLSIAGVATLLPALSAVRVDPVEALRSE